MNPAACEECTRLRADHYRDWNEFLSLMGRLDADDSRFSAELWLAEAEAANARCEISLRLWRNHRQTHRDDISRAA